MSARTGGSGGGPGGGLGDGSVARHTLYNVLGQGLPLLVALAALPALLRGMGASGFGVLGLVWMISSLFTEVGFARAGTRFAAEALGAGRSEHVAPILRAVLRVQLVTGLALGGGLALCTPLLVDRVLGVDALVRDGALASFLFLAAVTPALSVGAAFRSVLEAMRHWGALNLIRLVGNALTFAAPVAALAVGWGLFGIVALSLAARAGMGLAFGLALRGRIGVGTMETAAPSPPGTREILGFGGWAAVSTVVSPVLVSLDRFVLGAVAGVGAVGVYTAPYEAAMRVLILPWALATTLFPAVSALQGAGERERLRRLSRRATAAVALTVGPVALGLGVGAHPLLAFWLGDAFTPAAGAALALLAPGLLANALAQVPFTVLQGVGRADVPARFHLAEMPLHAAATWFLVTQWGVAGAAAAWSLRASVDAALLFAAAGVLAPGGRARGARGAGA